MLPAERDFPGSAVHATHQKAGARMGQMNRAVAREQEERQAYEQRVKDRFASTLVIGDCIIAAVRLARD
jgi:hypothetical protein